MGRTDSPSVIGFPLRGVTQGGLIEALAQKAPKRHAVEHPAHDLVLTYGGLDDRSRRLARGLVALGVEKGDRVAVWAKNVPDWIPMQFAVARIGAVLVTANPQLAPPEIAYLLRQSRTSVLVGERELLARGEIPRSVRHVVAVESLHAVLRAGVSVPNQEIDARCAETTADEPANIQYTSGTTGFPKGVVLTHRNVVENACTMARLLDVRAGERLLLMVPLHHCFGCVIVALGAFTHAATVVAHERFDAEKILAAGPADVVYGVPTMFRALLDHSAFAASGFRARAGIMAGAPCPEALMRRAIDEMCPGMVVAYGLTEASPSCTSASPGDPIELRCTSVGRAIDGVEVAVVDPGTGAERPRGGVGEIVVRGPNVMRGYFEDRAATAAALAADGRLRTGDLGTMDAAGVVRVVGRLKEMIKRGGECVFPAEVEDALRAHPSVADAAVFGVPDDFWGEEVAAAVVRRAGSALESAELLAFLDDRLAAFKRPTRVAFVAALPLTGSGKVQKFRLRELCGF